MLLDLIKVFIPAVLSFAIGIGITPLVSHYLYTHKMWKKKAGKVGLDGGGTPIFDKLHETKEVGTPRLGGVIIWISATATILILFVLAKLFDTSIIFSKLDFLSRDQTWIPLLALL